MSTISHLLRFLALVAVLSLSVAPLSAVEGQDEYASYWKCSNGATYGLVANGSKREFYVPSGESPLFFSGVKKGASYTGTIHEDGKKIAVSGTVSNNDTKITLMAADGRKWVLQFSSK